jgi:hypothetical protein
MEELLGYAMAAVFLALLIWRVIWGPQPSHHLNKRVRHLLERDAKQQQQIDAVVAQVETLLTNKRVKRVTIKRRAKGGVQPKG